MIGKEDENWLGDHYPELHVTKDGVSGTIEFRATYDQDADYFVVLPRGQVGNVSGAVLSCKYDIEIVDRPTRATSELPALYVVGLPAVGERHFESNGVACLCSPFEEEEFLQPTFQLRPYFEKLVIPYLYAQEFVTRYGRWPWGEYAHGATGLLQSYANIALDETGRCLGKLATTNDWNKVKALLQQNRIGGHTPCLCPKGDHFRRCHKRAWEGLQRLHQAIREQGLALP